MLLLSLSPLMSPFSLSIANLECIMLNKIFKTLFNAFCWLLAIMFLVAIVSEVADGEAPVTLSLIIAVLIILYLIVGKQIKKLILKAAVRNKSRIPFLQNVTLFKCKVNHINGLALPEGAECKVLISPANIEFRAMGQKTRLGQHKIVDVSVHTKDEIHKQYVSSAGGAVAGGMLFGVIGAAVGGSIHLKSYKENSNFLIFSYHADQEIKCIVTLIPPSSSKKAAYIEDVYKKTITNYAVTEL